MDFAPTLENEFVRLSPIAMHNYHELIPIAAQKKLVRFSPSDIETPQSLKTSVRIALDQKSNGTSIPFIIYDKTSNPKYVKTTRGAAYDILRNVFLDSDLVSETMTSTEITPGVDAVTSKAVLKNGEVVVYVVNKSPVSVPLDLSIDGSSISGSYVHEALQFATVDDFPSFNLSDSALTSIPPTSGSIHLPPLSISVLSGFTITVPQVVAGWDNFDSPATPSATWIAPASRQPPRPRDQVGSLMTALVVAQVKTQPGERLPILTPRMPGQPRLEQT